MKKILSLAMLPVLLLACAAELSGCGGEGRAENAGAAMSASLRALGSGGAGRSAIQLLTEK